MTSEDFHYLSRLLRQRSGLYLTEDKGYLLESRLTPIARRRGLADLTGLVAEIRRTSDEALMREITDAMTTNESFFFRDTAPFDNFRDEVLPRLLETKAHNRQIRIWCTAASTGQEPYSLAMILKEQEAKLRGWQIEILATDIAKEVVEKAKVGLYSQFEVQRGMPIQMLVKYFSEVGEMWQIAPEIRSMVTYRPFNLLDSFAGLGTFDVIFCRNVLIYFDQDTKIDVLNRLSKVLARHGVLFLGSAETVLGVCPAFRPIKDKRGMYKVADEQPA